MLLLIFQFGCNEDNLIVTGKSGYQEKGVTITNKGNYYDVMLDYTSGLTQIEMGKAYARGILQVVPNYEAIVDSYISETNNDSEYRNNIFKINDIKPQLSPEYKDEIDGMGTVLAVEDKNLRNDNKISKDEFYFFNLFPDTARGVQCCFVSVFGSRSSTGKTIAGRNLDWFGGNFNQLPKIQAVITYKYPDKKVCSIGYLGFMGIITGFNDSKVFAAILDSQTGGAYSSIGKRSYPLDLRYALENEKTLDEAAAFMKDPAKLYTVNHLIAFADPNESKVLENNIDGFGATGQRAKRSLRTVDSKLNKNVEWGISDAIGSVNSFLLYGNYDNHAPTSNNVSRWRNMKTQLLAKGSTVTLEELKSVITYKNGRSPGTFTESGGLYNKMTLQMVLFQPDNFSLEVYFRPKDTRKNPINPVFEKIQVFN
jgi:hypothetical protein